VAKIVILGAGLTGLSAAYHLEKRNFFDYAMFEKEQESGGLCRSVIHDGFTFDFTGHLLHASDPYFQQLLASIIGMEHMNSIHRESFIYSHETYTRYPFQINLFGLPPSVIAECIEGFATRPRTKKQTKTFHEWVLRTFGSGISKHFFFPFQEKIFSYPLTKVSPTWMGRFVPSTSLSQMIRGALSDTYDTSIGYNAHFLYPKKGGIQFWVDKVAKALTNTIHTNYSAEHIDLRKKYVRFSNGHEERFDILINTIPLNTFIDKLEEKPTTTFKRALNKLVCNTVVNFNLGIARPDLSTKHWIYFPEQQYPFYRVGFPHNFSQHMTPAGCSSLYGEFSYIGKSTHEINSMLKLSLTEVKKLFNLSDQEIITQKIITIPHAYVIYNFWREQHLPALLNQLEQEHIYSIGRYGGWKYSSMQEAVLDGKKIADTVTVIPATTSIYTSLPKRTQRPKELS
jgi:protoporphyrinogen oxidase